MCRAHIGEAISSKLLLCSSMSTVLESSGELHTEKLPREGKGCMAQPLFVFPSVPFTIFVALKVPLMKPTRALIWKTACRTSRGLENVICEEGVK